MLGELGLREILIIALVIVVLFGAKRIPQVAGSFGQTIRAFKRGIRDGED
jgi:sec-independent protein translocase protein TatA